MTAYIADTGVFVRCGGPSNEKYRRLRRAARRADISIRIPQRVFEEMGGTPGDEAYRLGEVPWREGLDEGWLVVADELDYNNPLVSGIMDAARRYIANATDRPEDRIEKADTALVGLAGQLLDEGTADRVVLLTTDKPAGNAAETLLPEYGFSHGVEFRYVSESYLTTITADEFAH